MKHHDQDLSLNILSVARSPVREETLTSLVGNIQNLKKHPIVSAPKEGYVHFLSTMQQREHLFSLSENDKAYTSYFYATGLMKEEDKTKRVAEIADLCLDTLPLTMENYRQKLSVSDDAKITTFLGDTLYHIYYASQVVFMNTSPNKALSYLEKGEKFLPLYNELLLKNGAKGIIVDNEVGREVAKVVDWKVRYGKEIGRILQLIGEYEKSTQYYETVVQYGEKMKNVFAVMDAKLGLAKNYLFSDERAKAREILKAIIKDEDVDSYILGTAYRLLAVADIHERRYIPALGLLDKSREFYTKCGEKTALALTDANTLICAYRLEDDTLAEKMAVICLEHSKENYSSLDIYIKTVLLDHLGNYYYFHRKEKEHKKGSRFYEQAVDFAKQSGMAGYELQARDLWVNSLIYNLMKNRVEAGEEQKVLETIVDNVDNICPSLVNKTGEKDVLRFHRTIKFLKEGIVAIEDWSSFDDALSVSLRESDEYDRVLNLARAGEIGIYRRKFERAEQHLDKAKELATEIENEDFSKWVLKLIEKHRDDLITEKERD